MGHGITHDSACGYGARHHDSDRPHAATPRGGIIPTHETGATLANRRKENRSGGGIVARGYIQSRPPTLPPTRTDPREAGGSLLYIYSAFANRKALEKRSQGFHLLIYLRERHSTAQAAGVLFSWTENARHSPQPQVGSSRSIDKTKNFKKI